MLLKKLTIFAMLLALNLMSSLGLKGSIAERAKTTGATVVSWPAPAGERLFEDYTLRVNGQPVPVYSCRVSAMPFNQVWPGYQRPLDQTEFAGFAYWSMSGPVTVEVISKRTFKSVAVRPSSRAIRPAVEGQRIRFELSRPGQFTVELDGPHHALHLFADPPETGAPKRGDANVIYFGPGVHHPGKIHLKNGQTIYIAGGAVVYTAITGREVSGAQILGRGVIDTSEFARNQGGGSISLEACSDIKIDGIIIRDSDLLGLSAYGSRKLAVSDVKLVGFWRYNSDGIHFCNCQEVTVRGSFIRSFDDAMVLSGDKGGSTGIPDRNYDMLPLRDIQVSGLGSGAIGGGRSRLEQAPARRKSRTLNSGILTSSEAPMWLSTSSRATGHRCMTSTMRIFGSRWMTSTPPRGFRRIVGTDTRARLILHSILAMDPQAILSARRTSPTSW